MSEAIGRSRQWPLDWLNANAASFVPSWGRDVEWLSIYDDERVSISVASVEALLAMKLLAGRPGRDTDDIAKLLVLTGIDSTDEAEALFEAFYPGDAIADRTVALLDRIFTLGLPDRPEMPLRPTL